ncbi:MAG: pilus assembly protein PilM [Candidatus Moraniibacteriota bacterium]
MFESIFGNDTFIGVDIGTSSVKVVELKVVNGSPVLSNYAWMSLGESMSGKGDVNSEYFYAALPRLLKKILKKANIKGKNVYISLPSFSGLIMLIDFPEIASDDMEQAIRFEAQKHIPTSLDDVVINWEVIGKKQVSKNVPVVNLNDDVLKKEEDEKTGNDVMLQVLLIVASKEKVMKYENLIKTAGLNLRAINLETFPIVRALIGNDPGSFVIVDIGANICNAILVERGIIKVNRTINAGGLDITKTIAKGMGIDNERASELKTSEKNFFEQNSPISFFALETITGEVSRIIKAYTKDNDEKKIDAIILSGGTASMVGISDYFSDKLKIKTMIGNPLSKIKYDPVLEPIISDIRSKFSICIGSAIGGVDEYLKEKAN